MSDDDPALKSDAGSFPFIMAIKDSGGNWVETGRGIGSLYVAGDVLQSLRVRQDPDDPDSTLTQELDAKVFTQVRDLKIKAKRPYSGTGSNIGPAVSGRVDLDDVFVEKYVDELSPLLFEYCCAGETIPLVVFVALDSKNQVSSYIRITDSYVSGYELIGGRYFGDKYNATTATMADTTEVKRDPRVAGTTRKEQVTFWYTAIAIDIYKVKTNDQGEEEWDRTYGYQRIHARGSAWDGSTDAPPATAIT